MKPLTDHQLAFLRAAARAQDGTVMAKGFSSGQHAVTTGKAMLRRGYVDFVKHSEYAQAAIYRITDAGRAALRAAVASRIVSEVALKVTHG